MVIKCEQCQTKFRLDDSKVTDKGVKVRCAKCKHVFTVQSEQTQPVQPDFNSFLEPAAAPPAPLEDAPFAPLEPETVAAAPSFLFDSDEGKATASFPMENADELSHQPEPSEMQPLSDPPEQQKADFAEEPSFFTDMSVPDSHAASSQPVSFQEEFPVEEDTFTGELEVAPSQSDEPAFGEFDFSDSVEEPLPQAAAEPVALDFGESIVPVEPPVTREVKKPIPQELDFSDDDMFGAVIQPPVQEEAGEAISFDMGDDNFADSMDLGSTGTGSGSLSQPLESKSDAPFSLGEIDFGDELTSVAVQQVNPDELKPSQEILFAPLAETESKEQPQLDAASFTPATESADEEQPPLPIASRRKQSPLFNGMLAVGACVVMALLGYIGYTTLSPGSGKSTEESGKISVSGVKASFVKNVSAGELLIITGEALNEYSKPRASLQVKGMVYDAAGQEVASKTAFGGNPLTEEQLKGMPLEKIEATMANQLGDSLANLEVAPGKAVPFVVVISKIPANAKDFGVAAAGSVAAAGKSQ